MADESTRRLVLGLRRALLMALKELDEYLSATSKRPERARRLYGPDGERGYLAELDTDRSESAAR